MIASSYKIMVQAFQFNICPPIDALFDFEDVSCQDYLSNSFETAISNPTILLDNYQLPSDNYLDLMDGIVCGTVIIVSDGSFDAESPIGPIRTSVVILASSIECDVRFYAKGFIWDTD